MSMTELADKLMQCYDSRELPSWYEIYDASTRLATLSRQLAEARAELFMWRASFPGSAEAVKRDALSHAAAMGTEK